MTPKPVTIVDGHDPAHLSRYGRFAAQVMAGGTVRDEDCVFIPTRRPTLLEALRWVFFARWWE